ncbi:DUF2514 family protein [Pseudomonas sp. Marseille-QA0892]
MTWLRATPLWAWPLVGGLLVGGAIAAGIQGLRWDADVSKIREEWSKEREDLERRARTAEAEQRAIERDRQSAVDEAARNGKEQTDRAVADANSLRDERDSLQQQFEAAERRSRACGNSLTAAYSQAADRAARVRADVFGRCTAAVALYAGISDERGIAGNVCTASYDSLEGGSR